MRNLRDALDAHTFQSVWTDENDGSFNSVLLSWYHNKVSILTSVLLVVKTRTISC